MQCPHFDAGRCHSCTLLDVAYPTQVREKEQHVAALLASYDDIDWLPPVTSVESGFRNKAKMVVTGTIEDPVLGILGSSGPYAGRGIDLTDCGLYPPALQAAFPVLAELVTRARIQPYDVGPSAQADDGAPRRRRVTARDAARRGELKHVLVTISPDGELMVRLVLRSQESVARIRKHLPWLRAALPQVAVVSVNIQPAHAAVLEGELEIVLTERTTLPMRVDGVTLHLRPQSFFQTNTDVAAALYRQARAWVDDVGPASLWDLYCGVGGFALHCAAPGREVTGVEISAEAIASAVTTRDELAAASDEGAKAMASVRFLAADATAFATAQRPHAAHLSEPQWAIPHHASDTGHPTSDLSEPQWAIPHHASDTEGAPDMVIVNPPRRGIGSDLARWLEHSDVRHVLYSSCNATTLAKDLADMPSLRPRRARLLDMFPQTSHYEVLVLLERVACANPRSDEPQVP